jgi:hypothetical protein
MVFLRRKMSTAAKKLLVGEKIDIGGYRYEITGIDTNAFGSPILRLLSENLPVPMNVTLIVPPDTKLETLEEVEFWVNGEDTEVL